MHPEKISCYVTSNLYKYIAVLKDALYFRLQYEESFIVYQYKPSKKIFVAPFCSLKLVLSIMEDVNQKALYRTQLLVTRKRSLCKI